MTQTTLFRQLLQERGWTTLDKFNSHFKQAARELAEQTGERKLADITVSQRSFKRWINEGLARAPQRDTSRVLEHLFAYPAERMLQPVGRADALVPSAPEADGSPVDPAQANPTTLSSSDVDPGLIPHWSELLHILSASHNALSPRRMYDSVTREMKVIRDHRVRADTPVRRGLMSVEARWSEFASWTAENLGNGQAAAFWLSHSLDLAQERNDAPMVAYILMRKAQRAAEQRDARKARDLATSAGAVSAASPTDRALSAVRLAHGQALAGDSRACSTALKTAYQFLGRADDYVLGAHSITIGRHCGPAYVQAHEAYCLLLLRRPADAARNLREALDSWPADFRQDERLARAWLALAYAANGHLAEAAAEGVTALTSGPMDGAVRILGTLQALDRQLAVKGRLPAEADQFRSTLALATTKMYP